MIKPDGESFNVTTVRLKKPLKLSNIDYQSLEITNHDWQKVAESWLIQQRIFAVVLVSGMGRFGFPAISFLLSRFCWSGTVGLGLLVPADYFPMHAISLHAISFLRAFPFLGFPVIPKITEPALRLA